MNSQDKTQAVKITSSFLSSIFTGEPPASLLHELKPDIEPLKASIVLPLFNNHLLLDTGPFLWSLQCASYSELHLAYRRKSLYATSPNEWLNLTTMDKTNIHVRISRNTIYVKVLCILNTRAIWKWFLWLHKSLFFPSSCLANIMLLPYFNFDG